MDERLCLRFLEIHIKRQTFDWKLKRTFYQTRLTSVKPKDVA